VSTELTEEEHREIQELLGVYALDAVDRSTAELVERHLADCVKCSIEVAQHHEVAGLLANSGGSSPAGLWDGIASHLDGSVPPSWERLAARLDTGVEPDGSRADRVVGTGGGSGAGTGGPDGDAPVADIVPLAPERRRNRTIIRMATVVAAAAAVVAVVLGVQVNHLNHQVSALQAGPSLTSAERAALSDPSTRQVRLTSLSSSSSTDTVTVVLTKSGTGFVEASRLTSLPADKTYQLWAVIGDQTISLGLLGSSPSVVPFSVAGNSTVSAFAITAERAGGVVHSVNQPVVAGEVTA
jgi:hypothetical protein